MDEASDPVYSRRHLVSSLIYYCWERGEGCCAEAALAPHFFDGTYTALELYIIEGAPSVEVDNRWVKAEAAAALSYERFAAEYMATNTPVLVEGLTSSWPANAEWTTTEQSHPSDPGCAWLVPNLVALAARYGTAEVQVRRAPESSLALLFEVELLTLTVFITPGRSCAAAVGR
jgi:hypothetical protein